MVRCTSLSIYFSRHVFSLSKMQIKMFRAVASDPGQTPFSERLKENLTFRNRSFFALEVGRLSGFKPKQMVGLYGYRRLTLQSGAG